MKKKKIVILGSNSFCGSHFINLLLEEKQFLISGVSRSPESSPLFLPYKKHLPQDNFTFYQIDIHQNIEKLLTLLDFLQPEFIINFSAQSTVGASWNYPVEWFQTNTMAIVQLIHQLKSRKYLKRFIQISTSDVYGSPQDKTVAEDTLLNPTSPYGISKAACDLSLLAYHRKFNFPVIILRLSYVYGSSQQLYKLIPRTFLYTMLNQAIKLQDGGRSIKSYVHIHDISRGILAALQLGRSGEIYHLSSNENFSVKEVVELIGKKMKVTTDQLMKVTDNKATFSEETCLMNGEKANNELGWCALKSLEQGLTEVKEWILTHAKELLQKPLDYSYKP